MRAPERESLSRTVTFLDQLDDGHEGPVVMVNTFTVDPGKAEAMLEVWRADSAVMKRQPGMISAQLHEGIANSGVFLNYAVWESVAHLKAAINNPEFIAAIARTPEGTIARPHVYRKIAVPGVCVA